MTKGKYTMSDFYCTNCGRQGIPIARKKGQQREQGHLKKLFCIYCGKDTNHVEVKPFGSYTYANFKEEFDLGRFVDGKRFPVAELQSCKDIDCPYNRHGKCWNSNNTVKCSNREKEEEKDDETKNLLNRGW